MCSDDIVVVYRLSGAAAASDRDLTPKAEELDASRLSFVPGSALIRAYQHPVVEVRLTLTGMKAVGGASYPGLRVTPLLAHPDSLFVLTSEPLFSCVNPLALWDRQLKCVRGDTPKSQRICAYMFCTPASSKDKRPKGTLFYFSIPTKSG